MEAVDDEDGVEHYEMPPPKNLHQKKMWSVILSNNAVADEEVEDDDDQDEGEQDKTMYTTRRCLS